ncbi:MAG: NADH-quinone oxidoreductase subunit A [Deltaproteobacteria bacterium]|nr:NADH-quinone oxidoreductase subunit A [Deltaproteobacteria bacterium]
MLQAWAPLIVYLAIALSVGFVTLLGAKILAVRAKVEPETKTMTYECGEEPAHQAWIRFHPRYYVVALVFILFDVETAFLVPWALNLRSLGTFAVVEMFIFVGILLLGWVYALKKGALKWQ